MPRPKGAGAKAQKAAQEAAPEPESKAAAEQPEAGPPAKKKRNNNPGVRVQGGRVYDSENGTTCHQCRQKTIETKAKCTACTLYFCPKCLENRYQERVEDANAAGGWRCPRCRGDCNCSNCRKKQGKEATGQLANIAKKAGFASVKDLLQTNPNAKAIQLPKAAAQPDAASGGGEGSEEQPAAAARKRAPKRKAAAVAAAAEQELVDDEALPPRSQAMPEAQPLAVHKAAAGGAAAGARRQRCMFAWAADVPEVTAVPEGQAGAELAVVLEFLQLPTPALLRHLFALLLLLLLPQVFGPKLQLRCPSLPAFAAELLQPGLADAEAQAAAGAAAGHVGRQQARLPQQLLCPDPQDSLVGAVHCRLLELVRTYWNVKGGVTAGSWQGIMRSYYAASLLSQAQALHLRWQHGPPAVAGEIFTRPSQAAAAAEEAGAAPEGGAEAAGGEGESCGSGNVGLRQGGQEAGGAAEAALGAAPAAAVDFPEGSYWALPAEVRVGLLHALVNDALECGELRQLIEDSMGDALDEEKERRQQLAGVRKEAREAIARERDQQIALLVASAHSSSLTLEEQQQLLEQARQRAEAAAATAAAAKVKALTEKVHPPTVRAAVVGCDRDGRRYLQLQVAPLLTGDGGVVVQSGSDGSTVSGSSNEGPEEALACHPAAQLADVAAALHPQGRREGPLREALLHAFKLPAPAAEMAAGTDAGQPEREQGVVEAAVPAAPPAGEPVGASGGGTKRGTKQGSGRNKASSPAPSAEAACGAADAPAGKRHGGSRQSSEAGSSAQRAAPKRHRRAPACASAPAGKAEAEAATGAAAAPPKKKAAARGTQRSRRAPAKGTSGAVEQQGEGQEAASVLPLKVDDMLTA